MKRWALLLAVAAVATLGSTALIVSSAPEPTESTNSTSDVTGRIVDESGQPITGTEIDLGGDQPVTTDGSGRFRAPLRGGPQLVTARTPGYLPRTQAVQPGTPTEIRLTSRPDETVSIRIGGDVMFGRRFYDYNDNGDRRDGLLKNGASASDHAALLTHVGPLLNDADLTVINFETPLLDPPWIDPTAPRPANFHPTKDYVFATSPAAVQALTQSGVDLVSLGNNHVNDGLGEGLANTLTTLDQAGLPHFGAGRTVDEAWAPAIVERKGQRIAFLACTTITGTEHPIPYVADDRQGGAARCTSDRLDQEVRAARAKADIVAVMIHGGEEYEPRQTEVVRGLSRTATTAGATVVADGHPHVVGDISLDGSAVVAESLGTLLFDQTVWPTFLSYLLRVDLRAGRPVLATTDPLLIEGYVPRPTIGLVADAAARKATGLTPAATGRLQPPGAVLTASDPPATTHLDRALSAGTIARLAPGWWVDGSGKNTTPSAVVLGEDLLWTGSFEDMDTDPATTGAHAWTLSANATTTPTAACGGTAGVELNRSPVSTMDVIATPEHRQLTAPGAPLSLIADIRDASSGSTIELRWYPDTKGPSTATTSVPIPAGSYSPNACHQVRIDATVPDGIVAVQPIVRLAPPLDVYRGARLAIDNVQLIAWAPPGQSGRRFDVLDAREDTSVSLTADAEGPGDPFAYQSIPSP